MNNATNLVSGVNGNAWLYSADCFASMDDQPEGSVDAILTDPPYCSGAVGEAQRTSVKGQGLRSQTMKHLDWFVGDNMGTAGLVWLLRTVAVASRKIVKDTGHLLVFCDWRMVVNLAPAIESAGLRYQNLIVWNKNGMGLGTGFRPCHELVLHFTYGNPKYHAEDVGNVISNSRMRAADRQHQTHKPVPLLQQLLRVVAPGNGRVLDCFMGSGQTGVAAAEECLEFVGCEHDPKIYDVALRLVGAAYRGEPTE